MSDVDRVAAAGKVASRPAGRAAGGRSLARAAVTGRYPFSMAAPRRRVASGAGACRSKASKAERVLEAIELRRPRRTRRKRTREENERLVAAAKALVFELRNDRKSLPDGI